MDPILINLPSTFTSERLKYRTYTDGDGEEYYNLLQVNKEHLQEAAPEVEKIKDINDAEVFTRNLMVAWSARKRFVLVVQLKGEKPMIGQIWIEPIDWDLRIFEIGYFVVKEHEGKGYITEAVKRCCEFIFDELGGSKVEIHYDAYNVRSGNVAKRAGFSKEGQLRKRTKRPNGSIVDRIYYGLLTEEFKS